MNKLSILQRQAEVGTCITLHLTTGGSVVGLIKDLNDDFVLIDLNDRTVTVFSENISTWELPKVSVSRVDTMQVEVCPASTLPIPVSVSSHSAPVSATKLRMNLPSVEEPITALRIELAKKLASVKAALNASIQQAKIDAPDWNTSFRTDEFPERSSLLVKNQWDKMWNQYKYALKIRDRSRINPLISQTLQPLIDQFPESPSLRLFAAQLLLELDQTGKAEEHCKFAAAVSNNPEAWYALAFVAKDRSPLECYALRQYFLTAETTTLGNAWFNFLDAALDLADILGLVAVFTALFQRAGSKDNSSILNDSLIFALLAVNLEAEARDYVDSMLRGAQFPFEEVCNILAMSANACPSIADVERELSELSRPKPQVVIKKVSQSEASEGHIVSFGPEMFGFIEDLYRERHFFQIYDVEDEELRTSLGSNTWFHAKHVDFVSMPNPGQKYRKALKIVSHLSLEKIIQLVEKSCRQGNFTSASNYLKRIRGSASSDERVIRLEQVVSKGLLQERMRTEGTGLPKGDGPYAQAKRAQLVDQNLDNAERLYRQAIAQGDKVESAVKDLASLLQQRGDSKQAIELILQQRKSFKTQLTPYDNHLATLYQQAGQDKEAINILRTLLASSRPEKQTTLMRRLAFCEFRSKNYLDAEYTLNRLLSLKPGDAIAEKWLASLEEARESGDYGEAEHVFAVFGELADESIELSALARTAVENCSFEGVDPSKVQSNKFSMRDVSRLEDLAKHLGTKRPSDRASYYLSAAAILDRLAPEENSGKIHDYLRRYFASMGDAAWIGKKSADVVRSYYVESLSLVSALDLDEAWRTVVRYVGTYWPEPIESLETKLPRGGDRIGKKPYLETYRQILSLVAKSDADAILKGIIYLCTQSGFVEKATRETIGADSTLCELFGNWIDAKSTDLKCVEARWKQLLSEESQRLRKRVYHCQTLAKHQLTFASMEEVATQLRMLECECFALDLDRIKRLSEIAVQAQGFCRTGEYEDKERHYWMVTRPSEILEADIKNLPTKFSFEALLPVTIHIRTIVEEDFAQFQIASAPQVELRLLVDHYVPDRRGEIRLQVEVSNKPGCSPASSVELHIGPMDSPYYRAEFHDHSLDVAVRGGASVVTHIAVCPQEQASKDKAFPVHIEASYRNRMSETCRTSKSEWSVRLYDAASFVEVENRYAPYAEGGPVDDPEMFVGRGDIIEKLASTLITSASKHVVIFGQKRAGKSSVLEHLRRRLMSKADCIVCSFSLLDVATTLNEFSFLYRILQSIDENLTDLRYDGVKVPSFDVPSMSEMKEEPTLLFHQIMSRFVREMRADRDLPPRKLVLLIDEFTEIYKQIKRGCIDSNFMKVWKSIVEKKYFSSVLIGQDVMPAFKDAYPNEFGVTEDIRLTYLHGNDALLLIENPVGANRYLGKSTQRIIDLTAGSPYYTMMFCKRLVDYINATRALVVTEADVNAVEQGMLTGSGRLARDKFDNLICAGDGKEDSGIDPNDSFALCASIAKNADKGWCVESDVVDKNNPYLMRLITDLEHRDVIEKKGNAIRICVGIFNDWLLMNAYGSEK